MAPRYSEPCVITQVKYNKFTYVIKPVDPESRGREKQRHFDLLRTVKREDHRQDNNNMMMRPSRIGSPTLDPIEEEKCNSDDEELLEVQGTPELEVQGPGTRIARQRKSPARL